MPEHGEDPAGPPNVQKVFSLYLLVIYHWNEEIRGEKQKRPVKIRRRDTDDREWMLVELNYAPHYACVILKSGMPITVGEHNVRRTIRTAIVRGMEQPPQVRLHAQGIEIVPGYFIDPRT